MSDKRQQPNKKSRNNRDSKDREKPRSKSGATGRPERKKPAEGKGSGHFTTSPTRRQRPSRGSHENKFDEPNRGKSREHDHSKGSTRRNSTDISKQSTGFKVTRVKGKERELVWDADKTEGKKPRPAFRGKVTTKGLKSKPSGYLRLNRYIANSGVCSRREADVLIKAGVIKVNGEVVTEMGVQVGPNDVVHYGEQKLSREKTVYVLLNKPKDYVTTTRDPEGRKTVMQLVRSACKERIVPVGRLDRQTTGLLLFTNDGDLAKKLMHPKHGVSKLYHIHLDKKVSGKDIEQLLNGVMLEDGEVKADKVSYVGDNQRELGMEIHMGKNRVVRRMMEKLGYKVLKLDRVMFAGLTKKNLPKGHFRHLTEAEVGQLKSR